MRKWIIISVLFPITAWTLYKVAERLEAKRGESGMTKALRMPHRLRRRAA